MTRESDSLPRTALPAATYSGGEAWELDVERVFARAWHPLPPDALPVESSGVVPSTLLPGCLDEPLLLTRNERDELHALSNTCTHRGALVCSGPVRARELRCPYHGRRFELDGRFRSAPGFEGAPDFPSEADDLPRLDCAALGPMHLLSLASPLTLAQWGTAAHERFDPLGWSDYHHDPSGDRRFPLRAHWALYVENYLEGFHVPFVHPELARVLDLARYSTMPVPHGVLQVAEARDNEPAIEPPAGHPEHERRVAAWYLWLFPNLMLNLYPWGLSLNVVEPVGPRESLVRYHRFVRDPSLLASGAGANLDQVEREDQQVVESVQRGIGARMWRGGTLSPRHEQGLARFHALWLAAREA